MCHNRERDNIYRPGAMNIDIKSLLRRLLFSDIMFFGNYSVNPVIYQSYR